jgi:hypothetical protein
LALEVHLTGGVMAQVIKTQKTVTLSTTKLELNAISQAMHQALYMRKLFAPLQVPIDLPLSIVNNNCSALANIQNCKSVYTVAKKHYNLKIKHAHNHIVEGRIMIDYCPTEDL